MKCFARKMLVFITAGMVLSVAPIVVNAEDVLENSSGMTEKVDAVIPASEAEPQAAVVQEAVVQEAVTESIETKKEEIKKAEPVSVEPKEEVSELWLFEEMVEVASQEAEPLHEAPVITSVVTAEEIRRMGARTLNDVVLTIPGFSHTQDHNEYFSAERGIYASAQQKILVLRDGHRLNSRSYSEANFDYSISLDNVKRIEILRGPGGSLYGDVALTAVINIVTKDGKDIQGVELIAGGGDFAQRKAAIVAGVDMKAAGEVLFSGSMYTNDGQVIPWDDPRDVAGTDDATVYGFKDMPAYDFMLKYELDGLNVSVSRRYANYIEPVTGGSVTGLLYNLDEAYRFDGTAPGLSSTFNHSEIAYTLAMDQAKLTGTLFADGFNMRANLGLNPTAGSQGALKWDEWTGGGQVQFASPYEALGKGSFLVGAKAERMEVFWSQFLVGVYPNYSPAYEPVLKTGKEWTYAGFMQVKHRFPFDLIANVGLRYDQKIRRPHETEEVDDFSEISPRAALIYEVLNTATLRINYAHAFVDAPYWYRYNSLPSYLGAVNLLPEKMDSLQASVELPLLAHSLIQRLNFFANNFTDVVYRDETGTYTNAGLVKSQGLEYEIAYKVKSLSARANATYQKTIEAAGYELQDGKLESVPQLLGNVIVDVAPLAVLPECKMTEKIWLHVGLRYVGAQFSRWGKSLTDPRDSVDAAVLLNLGLTADEIVDRLSLGVHVYNVSDQKYYQGGSVDYPYQQAGRWFMGTISYKF